jgi:hypothetical protein
MRTPEKNTEEKRRCSMPFRRLLRTHRTSCRIGDVLDSHSGDAVFISRLGNWLFCMKSCIARSVYLWVERPELDSRQEIFFFSIASGPAEPTQPPIRYAPWGVKWPGRDVDHWSPSSADVKNVGAILSLPYTSYVFMAWCVIN